MCKTLEKRHLRMTGTPAWKSGCTRAAVALVDVYCCLKACLSDASDLIDALKAPANGRGGGR
jgi:hypothetical protein